MAAFRDIALYEPLDQRGIYLVHSPHTTIPYTCDIIIVHGLNGGTAKSFTHPVTGTIWFQHLLPDDVVNSETRTNARIWVYGYNADTTFENAGNTTAFDQATNLLESVLNVRKEQRKIIWVCHSLGGIIVKTALFQANSKGRYRAILRDTIGTIFIGTPHQGCGFANVADVAQKIAQVVLYKPKAIVTGLKKNCSQLFETANNFADVSGNIKVFCFYETRRPEIVTKESASTRIPGEVLLSMEDVKHADLCKFKDNRDPNYWRVRDSIRELMRTTSPPRVPMSFPWDENPYGSAYNQHPRPVGQQIPSERYTANTKYTRSPAFEPPMPPYPTDSIPTASYAAYNPTLRSQQSQPSLPRGLQVQDSSPHNRSQSYSGFDTPPTERPVSSQSYASTATRSTNLPSPNPSQPHSRSPSADRSVSSQSNPPPGNHSLPTSAYRNSRLDTTFHRESPPLREEESPVNSDLWTCDFCMDGISADKPRAHCTVCDDYDLCIDCYKKDRTSKTHQAGHKMRPIIRTKLIGLDELAFPSDEVNPYLPPEDKKSNWTIDEKDIRWDNLRTTDSHDRYLATNLGAGYFRPDLVLRLKLSKHLNATTKATLSKDGIGKLRVTIGFPKSKDVFLHKSFPENANLKSQLFTAETSTEIILRPEHEDLFRVDIGTARITIDQPKTQLGILIQWTGMRGFANLDDPIAQIAVEHLRLEELFDRHTESTSSESEASSEQQATATKDDDDDEQLNELFAQVIIEGVRQNRIREQRAREEAAAQFLLQKAQEERERQARILAARRQQQQQQQAAVNTLVGYAYLAALLDESNR